MIGVSKDPILEQLLKESPIIQVEVVPEKVICLRQTIDGKLNPAFDVYVYIPKSRAVKLERKAEALAAAIEKMWPIVTKHTTVSFWGPIENELRKAERLAKSESKEDE